MNRQPELCRKRSAFRQKIRKQYIDNLFKQRRQQWQNHEKMVSSQSQHIKEIHQFSIFSKNSSNHKSSNQQQIKNPFRGLTAERSQTNTEAVGNQQLKINRQYNPKQQEFSSYEQFQQHIDQSIQLMPGTIHTFVSLFNNHPALVSQFINYLFAPAGSPAKELFKQPLRMPIPTYLQSQHPRLNNFISKFSEPSPSELLNFIHVIQSMLIKLPQGNERRLQLRRATSEKISQQAFRIINTNKFYQKFVMKGYFDYYVTLGDEIRQITNLEMNMLANYVTDIFGKYFAQDEQTGDYQLYNSVIVVCNNIVSLPQSLQQTHKQGESRVMQYDMEYKTEQQKQTLICQLLKHPKSLQNLILLSLCPNCNNYIQHILRFLVNLTYTIGQPERMQLIAIPLAITCMSFISQIRNMRPSSAIPVFVLKCVNNVAVNDVWSGEIMWRQGVLSKCVEVFGYWIIDHFIYPQNGHKNCNQTKNSSGRKQHDRIYIQPQIQVYSEFLSTITTYIIMLSNNSSKQGEEGHNRMMLNPSNQQHELISIRELINNLQVLINDKHVHLIILQSLTKKYILQHDVQLVSKCLQALLVLANYETQQSKIHSVNMRLVQYRELFQSIADHFTNTQLRGSDSNGMNDSNNIIAFCNQILQMVGEQTRIIEENRREKEEQQNSIRMYDQCCQQLNINTNNSNASDQNESKLN